MEFLRKYPHSEFNAKTIDRALFSSGINYLPDEKRLSNVKVALTRLVKSGDIKRTKKGYYQVYADRSMLFDLEDPPLMLHGLKLRFVSIEKFQDRVLGTNQIYYRFDIIKFFEINDFFKVPQTKNRFMKSVWWRNRKVTITFNLNSTIDVYIGCSNNPLLYPDFIELLSYLNGFLSPVAPFEKMKDARVTEVGINRDFHSLRLDGVESISLTDFANGMASIYYKEKRKATRFEFHIKPVSMTLDVVLECLMAMTRPLNDYKSYKKDDYIDVT